MRHIKSIVVATVISMLVVSAVGIFESDGFAYAAKKTRTYATKKTATTSSAAKTVQKKATASNATATTTAKTAPITAVSNAITTTSTKTAPQAGGNVLFSDAFEDNTLSKWSWFETVYNYKADPRAIEIVQDPVNSQNNVLLFKAYDSDPPYSSGDPRSEIIYDTRGEFPHTASYSWKFMIDKSYDNDSIFDIMGQWHSWPDESKGETWENWEYASAPPLVSMLYKDDQVYIVLANATLSKKVESKRYPIEKGEWVDIKFNIKWSTGYDGYTEVWINGEPVEFVKNTSGTKAFYPTLINDVGNILKLGTYRPRAEGGNSIVYYDDVRIESLVE